jgi:hypothetical protein
VSESPADANALVEQARARRVRMDFFSALPVPEVADAHDDEGRGNPSMVAVGRVRTAMTYSRFPQADAWIDERTKLAPAGFTSVGDTGATATVAVTNSPPRVALAHRAHPRR